jgi:hypothetical protein
MKIQYQVDTRPNVGLDSTIIPTQVKKKNKETTTTKFALRNKKNSNCSNHLQSGHLFGGGRWGSTR